MIILYHAQNFIYFAKTKKGDLMKKTFKSAVSVFLSILMLLSVLPATVYAQDSQQYSIRIVNVDDSNADVSADTGTVISLKENDRVQLKAVMADGTEIPEDMTVSWYSATPYLASVDENGLVTGRDSSKGAIFRVWVDTNIASIWLIGPSLADSIYSTFDNMELDSMDAEGIVETFRMVATPILGETIVNGLADSLLNTLSTINVEIKATLKDSNSNELATNSAHINVLKSTAFYADFIPNGTTITNKESLPTTVEVGYQMKAEGITTPLRLEMGVKWNVTSIPSGVAEVDEDGNITFLKAGKVKITASPSTEGLYNKLTEMFEFMESTGKLINGELIADILVDGFGLNLNKDIVAGILNSFGNLGELGSNEDAEAFKKVVAQISDWILSISVNDSITVTVVDQLDITSFDIYGDVNNLSTWGGTRQLTVTNVQPEGAVINDIEWQALNPDVATIDENGVLTIRDGKGSFAWDKAEFEITATIDGITKSTKGTVMGGNISNPTDLEFSGPTELTKNETAQYEYTVYPSTLTDSGLIHWKNVHFGVMVDGEVVYANGATDGVLRIDDYKTGKVTAVGGGETTLYCRTETPRSTLYSGEGAGTSVVKECTVSVTEPVEGVTIAQGDKITVEGNQFTPLGSTTQLEAVITNDRATNKNVSWSSSNTSKMKVDSNGVVTCMAVSYPATAVITATTEDGGFTASCEVTFVKQKVDSVAVDVSDITIIEGSSQTVKAVINPSDATIQDVEWSSSDEAVATVENGVVTAVSTGDAVITVTTKDGGFTAECNVKVRADKTALVSIIDKVKGAELNEADYSAEVWQALQSALSAAEEVNANDLAAQSEVDKAAAALTEAYSAMGLSQAISSVSIVSDTAVREGDVMYVQIPWYALYKNQTVDLSVEVNEGVDVQSVSWSYADWSVESPEAELTADGDKAQVKSTSITAGSTWITVTVEDAYGNEMSDTVKVRFIKYDWQK